MKEIVDVDIWRRRIEAEKEWERRKRDPYRVPVPWRPARDSWPASSEPDYGDNPFGPESERVPAPKKRKRKKPSKPKEKKPKQEPSRITPGVPVRDLIFDEPEKK